MNGRIVRDRNIAHAVRMAYASGIPDGRHAAYALHLEVPRESVDVNVHPGKTEVRIYDYVDREVPMLFRMFERRLRGYRAIGYARGEAPLGFGEAGEELVVEYDAEGVSESDAVGSS